MTREGDNPNTLVPVEGGQAKRTTLSDPVSGNPIGIQYPLCVDGDSVYAKDVWVEESNINTFTGGDITDLFDNLHSVISDVTSTNPKELFIHFNRTTIITAIALGAVSGNFSNVKISILVSGDVEATIIDESADGTKYTSRQWQLPAVGFNAIRIQFHTADTVTLSNIFMLKALARVSRISIQKPDDTFVEAQGTAQGNFKISLEELENIISINSNEQLKVSLLDLTGRILEFDNLGKYLVFLESEHHHIHDGIHYEICDYALAVANAATIDFRIVTPDTAEWDHLLFEVTGSSGITLDIYESPTDVTVGAAVIPVNNNRNSLNTANMLVFLGPTVTVTGTKLIGFVGGANQRAGIVDRENENILKRNTEYLFRITSLGANNNISYCSSWYEQTGS